MAKLNQLKNRARREEQRENWSRAIELYTQALEVSQRTGEGFGDLSLYNRIGDIYLRIGQKNTAVRYYEQAIDRYAEQELHTSAIALCNKVLRVLPDRTGIFLRLGRLHLATNLVAEARNHYHRYANAIRDSGRNDAALDSLEELFEHTGDGPTLKLWIDWLREMSERPEAELRVEAFRDTLVAQGADPDDVLARVRAAVAPTLPDGAPASDDPITGALPEPDGIDEGADEEVVPLPLLDDVDEGPALPILEPDSEDAAASAPAAEPPGGSTREPAEAPWSSWPEDSADPAEDPELDALFAELEELEATVARDEAVGAPDMPPVGAELVAAVEHEEPATAIRAAEDAAEEDAAEEDEGAAEAPRPAAEPSFSPDDAELEPAAASSSRAPAPGASDAVEAVASNGARPDDSRDADDEPEAPLGEVGGVRDPLELPRERIELAALIGAPAGPTHPHELGETDSGWDLPEPAGVPAESAEGTATRVTDSRTSRAAVAEPAERFPAGVSSPLHPLDPEGIEPGRGGHDAFDGFLSAWDGFDLEPASPDAVADETPSAEGPEADSFDPGASEKGECESGPGPAHQLEPVEAGSHGEVERTEKLPTPPDVLPDGAHGPGREADELLESSAGGADALANGLELMESGRLEEALEELEAAAEAPDCFTDAYLAIVECRGRLGPAAEDSVTEPATETRPAEPGLGEPEPVMEAPPLEVPEPEPVMEAPPPEVPEPEPVLEAPAPEEPEPEPVLEAPPPEVSEPEPVMEAPAPEVSEPEPVTPAPLPEPRPEPSLLDEEPIAVSPPLASGLAEAATRNALEVGATAQAGRAEDSFQESVAPVAVDPETEFREWVGSAPTGVLRRALGELEKRSELDKGLLVVRRLIEAEPLDLRYHAKRLEYVDALGDRSELVPAHLDLARAQEAGGDIAGAAETCRRLLQIVPDERSTVETLKRLEGLGDQVQEEAADSIRPTETMRDSGLTSHGRIRSSTDAGRMPDLAAAGAELKPTPYSGVAGGREASADFEQLLSEFRAELSDAPASSGARSRAELGASLKQMGRLDDAIRELQTAVREPHASPLAFELLGEAFLEKGQPRIAMRILSDSLASATHGDREMLGVLYQLGTAHEQLGEPANALACYERIFSVDIDYKDVQDRILSCQRRT